METATPASSTVQVSRDQLECVQGKIAFARRTTDEIAPSVVLPGYDIPMVEYDVTIRDARPIVPQLSLDREGFTLIQHKTSCADVNDPEVMRDKYLEEMVPLVKDYFNASWVVGRKQGVIVRSAAASSIPGVRGTISPAHIDYAPVAGPVVAAIEDQVQGIQTRPYSRLMIIQAWRALSPAPQDTPLALTDGSTIRPTDISIVDYVSGPGEQAGANFKSCVVKYNAEQRWYYFANMTPNDLILFKGYDSEVDCNPKSAHCAFDNRRAYTNAIPRRSVEARFFVYYA